MILCCCHLILPIRFVIWSAPVLGHKTRKYLTQPHFQVFLHKKITKIAAAHNFVDFWPGKLRIWVTNEMLGKHCNVSYNCKWLQEWPDLWPKLSIQKMKETRAKEFRTFQKISLAVERCDVSRWHKGIAAVQKETFYRFPKMYHVTLCHIMSVGTWCR